MSLLVYVVWIIITLLGARILTGGETSLNELVSSGVGWHFAMAIAWLLLAAFLFRWSDLHFGKAHSLLRVLWFPSIYLLLFALGIGFTGMPAVSIVCFVVINTLMVGMSEEIMFRGVLFRAFEKAMPIWPAILLTSLLFGAVHALNGFITGDFGTAMVQSIAAAMSGLVFMAILLRTGSIWPAIIYHFLWDCLIFLMSVGANAGEVEAGAEVSSGGTVLAPILLNLPNMICALILLRRIDKGGREGFVTSLA